MLKVFILFSYSHMIVCISVWCFCYPGYGESQDQHAHDDAVSRGQANQTVSLLHTPRYEVQYMTIYILAGILIALVNFCVVNSCVYNNLCLLVRMYVCVKSVLVVLLLFITALFSPPCSSMGVAGSKMVKVLRLQEPVRGGQATLDQLN